MSFDSELPKILEYDLCEPVKYQDLFDMEVLRGREEFLIRYLENQNHIEDTPMRLLTRSGQRIPARVTISKSGKHEYHGFIFISPYQEAMYKRCA